MLKPRNFLKADKVNRFIITFFIIGLIGLIIPQSREYFVILIPFTLLMSISLLLAFHKQWSKKAIVAFSFIAFLGYFVEVIGVNTGLVFGEYNYDYALGFEIFNTPLLIGVNWLLLIYCVTNISMHFPFPTLLQVIAAATLMLVFDLILEPVAIKLNMWHWEAETIPLKNYAAWFIISLVFIAFLRLLNVKLENKIALTLFFAQLGFFIGLHIIFRFVE